MTPDQRAIVERVAAMPDRLAAAARAAPPEPPAPGEWPPTDVVRHLIAVEEEVWHPRLRQLIAEDEPHWAWVEPGPVAGVAGRDPRRAARDVRRPPRDDVALLDDLGADGWARTGVHETFGRLDVAGLMEKALDHDDEHIASLAPPSSREG